MACSVLTTIVTLSMCTRVTLLETVLAEAEISLHKSNKRIILSLVFTSANSEYLGAVL